MKNSIILALGLFFFTSCSTTSFLKYEREKELRKNEEFEQKVIIKPVEEVVVVPPPSTEVTIQTPPNVITEAIDQTLNQIADKTASKTPIKSGKPVKVVKSSKSKKDDKKNLILVVSQVRQPEIEDNEGFAPGSRRPLVDPFRINEKVIHSVRYFSAEAGLLTFQTKPMVEVNNRKSYQFVIGLKTSSLFSKFYSVDDFVETFLDYETLVPHVFKMNARETGKLVQANSYFDHQSLKATFWEKKYTEKNGEEIKNQVWDLLPFSQNAFSGLYYMRLFKWEVGKEYSFRVSDDEKNVVFKGVAEKKEIIETDAGEFKAIKIKALILSRGALTPTGNIYIWVSDDSRKLILRIVAEIKIGKLVSEVIEID